MDDKTFTVTERAARRTLNRAAHAILETRERPGGDLWGLGFSSGLIAAYAMFMDTDEDTAKAYAMARADEIAAERVTR